MAKYWVSYPTILKHLFIYVKSTLKSVFSAISASSAPQQTIQYGQTQAQTYTQYTVTASPGYAPITSSPQQLTFTSQPPPPPPPMFEGQGQVDRSRSPGLGGVEDKLRMINTKYIPLGPRDDILSQPPPPPRSYW